MAGSLGENPDSYLLPGWDSVTVGRPGEGIGSNSKAEEGTWAFPKPFQMYSVVHTCKHSAGFPVHGDKNCTISYRGGSIYMGVTAILVAANANRHTNPYPVLCKYSLVIFVSLENKLPPIFQRELGKVQRSEPWKCHRFTYKKIGASLKVKKAHQIYKTIRANSMHSQALTPGLNSL